ncbi:hypothetical protein DPEC_G00309940 [Dallia pectoralis]|uniref:Uncharacterized protein n=1 Tax=Dallia pectoralis TaxID=75939 RepID=A0ACC2FF22_DALPE|nr:hypothetical protein DPEC_G00309940 [Dallia pectoralis]
MRILGCILSALLLCGTALSQYSSDQCSWRGSGLTHEGHARDVEQVYLRCSQGSLEWLYPTGAVIVNLRPNTPSPAGSRLTVCIKPSTDSNGANIYLDRAGKLRLLLPEHDQALGKVTCFSVQEGALFIEAIPHRDISRRITSFQYELFAERTGAGTDLRPFSAPCQPCTDAELLLAVCTSDFVGRGSILGIEQGAEQSTVTVAISRLYKQKTQVFAPGEFRARRWTGTVRIPRQCGVKPGTGDFLFTGSIRFGEAWMGCAPRYKDFLRVYRDAEQGGTNPCHVDTN